MCMYFQDAPLLKVDKPLCKCHFKGKLTDKSIFLLPW